MDDVRLTPAERRALERIEAELRQDRDLDRAMRRMRPPRTGRRPLHRHKGEPDETPGTQHGDNGESGEGTMDAPGEYPLPVPAARHDRRRAWALALVLSVVFAALLSAGTVFFLVFALVVVTLAASAGVVWMCVSFYLRRPDTG